MKKKNLMYDDKDSRIDYGVILPVLLLAFLSIATLFSTTYLISGNTSLRMVFMQVVWYMVGVVAIVVIMQFDSEQLWKLTTWGYILGLLMLLAVLFVMTEQHLPTQGRRVGSDLGPSPSSLPKW